MARGILCGGLSELVCRHACASSTLRVAARLLRHASWLATRELPQLPCKGVLMQQQLPTLLDMAQTTTLALVHCDDHPFDNELQRGPGQRPKSLQQAQPQLAGHACGFNQPRVVEALLLPLCVCSGDRSR